LTDIVSEVAALKAQLNALISSDKTLAQSVSSIWVVYDPSKISVWCSKTDCPLLERDVTYDVIKEEETEDGELESIIKHGVSEEESQEYDGRIKRVSSPRVKHHDLGVLASFTSKKKATDYIEEYFRLNRETLSGKGGAELGLSEIKVLN
jgi:hypothetical protein|tara:strand:- start:5339 stop:5788 length:450 start_codon:yes stop_codon:yes gene_type:complete